MNTFEFRATATNGAGCMTNYVECIPWDNLDSMVANGVTFRVNGKKITKAKLRELYFGKTTAEVIGESAAAVPKSTESTKDQVTVRPDPAPEKPADKPELSGTYVEVYDEHGPICHINAQTASFKEIKCLEDGKVFKNQSAAARYYDIDPAQVSDSIKTGRKRSGYTFGKVIW